MTSLVFVIFASEGEILADCTSVSEISRFLESIPLDSKTLNICHNAINKPYSRFVIRPSDMWCE